jgi:chaperonin GroES
MKLKPLHDNVVVKPASAEETTASGIVLPETSKERPEKGEVVAVGPGRHLENGQLSKMDVKVGDKIMFKKYSPDEIKIDGEEYLLLRESDIIAILE